MSKRSVKGNNTKTSSRVVHPQKQGHVIRPEKGSSAGYYKNKTKTKNPLEEGGDYMFNPRKVD